MKTSKRQWKPIFLQANSTEIECRLDWCIVFTYSAIFPANAIEVHSYTFLYSVWAVIPFLLYSASIKVKPARGKAWRFPVGWKCGCAKINTQCANICHQMLQSRLWRLYFVLFAVLAQQRRTGKKTGNDGEHNEESAPAENNHRGRWHGGQNLHADNLHTERVPRGVHTHSVRQSRLQHSRRWSGLQSDPLGHCRPGGLRKAAPPELSQCEYDSIDYW